MNKYIKLLLSLTIMFIIGCEDNDDEAGATSVASVSYTHLRAHET